MAERKERLTREQLVGMVALGLAVFVVANDFTAFSVALPAMEKSLDADVSTIQWVVNGYTLVFASLIVTGGRIADKFGRRRVFVLGASVFALFSLVAGLSDRLDLLLASRAMMGVGGALMWPATVGMIYALLPPGRAGLGGGLILGVSGIGNASGPLIGGVLTDSVGWHWIFLVNIPVAVIGVTTVLVVIGKDERTGDRERFDYLGVGLFTTLLLALLLALDFGLDKGWTSPPILGLFAYTALALGAFVFTQSRIGDRALIPPKVALNRDFAAAAVAILFCSANFFAVTLYIPQFLTKQLGYSPVMAGVGFLPMMLTFAVVSFVAGGLYERLGAKLSVGLGAGLLTLGMLLLSDLGGHTTYADLVPGMVALGIGIGLFFSSATTSAITTLDPAHASLGGAIAYMCIVAGGSIGLGVNTAIVVSAKHLPAGIGDAFLVDCVASGGAVVVALLFVRGLAKPKHGPRSSRRHRHRAHG